MPQIDPLAKVHPQAELADDVVVGPYTLIDRHVRIGAGSVIDAHCVVTGHTELGARNHLFPFASVGTPPQDLSYKGEPTRLLMGDGNQVREFVTINTGTVKGGGITIIGSQCMLMACSHVAHDCQLGDRVIMDNCALVAGHVKIEDGAILSGHAAVHQFVTIGTIAMLGGLTGVTHDVPPYMMMVIDHHAPRGVNVVGMKRNGYTDHEIESVQRAYRLIYRSGLGRVEAEKQLTDMGMITRATRNVLDSMKRSEAGKLGRYLEISRQERGGPA